MPKPVRARSISSTLLAWLRSAPRRAVVRGVFERAVVAVTDDEQAALALVLPEAGDGPINVVVEAPSFADLAAGMAVRLDGEHIEVGPWAVALGEASQFNPRPDWLALRHRLGGGIGPEALASLNAPGWPEWMRASSRVREGLAALCEGFGGSVSGVQRAADVLGGLGPGLTPGGDDVLCGAMLAAHLVLPDPASFCEPLAAAAAPRTNALAAAFLRAAARGECSAAWQGLLASLAAPHALPASIAEVLRHGATSGADMLAGFASVSSQHARSPRPA